MSRRSPEGVTSKIRTLITWKYHHRKEQRKLSFESAIRFGKGCWLLFGTVFPQIRSAKADLIDLWGAVNIVIIFYSFFGPGPQFRTFSDGKNVVLMWKIYCGGQKTITWVWRHLFCFKSNFFQNFVETEYVKFHECISLKKSLRTC